MLCLETKPNESQKGQAYKKWGNQQQVKQIHAAGDKCGKRLAETHMLKQFITLTTIARMLSTLLNFILLKRNQNYESFVSEGLWFTFSPVFLLPICISFLFKLFFCL